MIEKIKTFGGREQLPKKPKFGVKLSEKEVESFYTLIKKNMSFCKSLMFDHFVGQKSFSEETLFQLTRLYSNSYLFKDYLDRIIPPKKLDIEGLYSLEVEEVQSVTKCIICLIEAKQELQASGISLVLQ